MKNKPQNIFETIAADLAAMQAERAKVIAEMEAAVNFVDAEITDAFIRETRRWENIADTAFREGIKRGKENRKKEN